jgi:hypothetical protein
VSALIIILIVAAAIYAFSDDQQGEPTADQELAGVSQEETTAPQEETAPEETSEEESVEEAGPQRTPQIAAESSSTTAPQKQVEQLSPAQKTEQGYEETAQPGEGITHLARRATTRWLTENKVDFALTPEHLIYVEDYIQNRIGSKGLTLGEKQTISFDLIKEAVMAAKELDERQLKNLSQYTHVLNK